MVPLVSSGQIVGPGPGFFPLIFSSALFILNAFSFFKEKSDKKFNFHESLFSGSRKKAFIFFFLNCLLLLFVYTFGLVIAILVFSLLSGFILKRQDVRSVFLFSAINTFVFYIVFIVLFKMAFPQGMFFRLLGIGWYI